MNKLGFNKYIVEDNITKIILKDRKGNVFYGIIDTDDLPRLIELDYRWCARYHKHVNNYYVQSSQYINGKHVVICLHQYILNHFDDLNIIDHKNQNPLDNRKANLRILTHQNNQRNRKAKNSNNKSGYRNVFWNNGLKKWQLSLCSNYKIIVTEYFDDIDEAGKAAEEARKKYFGDFAGNN